MCIMFQLGQTHSSCVAHLFTFCVIFCGSNPEILFSSYTCLLTQHSVKKTMKGNWRIHLTTKQRWIPFLCCLYFWLVVLHQLQLLTHQQHLIHQNRFFRNAFDVRVQAGRWTVAMKKWLIQCRLFEYCLPQSPFCALCFQYSSYLSLWISKNSNGSVRI